MAHSLTTAPPTTSSPISAKSNKKLHIPPQRICASEQNPEQVFDDKFVLHRRDVTLGLVGAVLGLNVAGERTAQAARRPPPPPPEEKKDPNVSGVQAKVLASKKRKEAMKQEVAKLREKGKAVNETSQKIVNEKSE